MEYELTDDQIETLQELAASWSQNPEEPPTYILPNYSAESVFKDAIYKACKLDVLPPDVADQIYRLILNNLHNAQTNNDISHDEQRSDSDTPTGQR